MDTFPDMDLLAITQDPSWIIFARATKHSVVVPKPVPCHSRIPNPLCCLCIVYAASLPEPNGEIQEHELYHWVENFVYVRLPVMDGAALDICKNLFHVVIFPAWSLETVERRDADDDAGIKYFQSLAVQHPTATTRRQRPAPKEYIHIGIRTTSSRYFAG